MKVELRAGVSILPPTFSGGCYPPILPTGAFINATPALDGLSLLLCIFLTDNGRGKYQILSLNKAKKFSHKFVTIERVVMI